MRDYAYEDLETEAVKELEDHEKYEAECARPFLPTPPYTPTPTNAAKVKKNAEFSLKCLTGDPASRYVDLEILRMIIQLADAIDER